MRRAEKIEDHCTGCKACRHVACPVGRLFSMDCIGCGACRCVCPSDAIELRSLALTGPTHSFVRVNDKSVSVAGGTLLIDVLRDMGFIGSRDGCSCGGCSSCAAVVDGVIRLACTTAACDGREVFFPVPKAEMLRRAVVVEPHYGGACGTPFSYRLAKGRGQVMEIVAAASGCNFRCPSCQAFGIAFGGRWGVMNTQSLAGVLSRYTGYHGVDRVIISGGEPTANIPWFLSLMEYLNDDSKINHVNLDTNGSLLTSDLLEHLCQLGLTNLSLDLKSIRLGTFMANTGIKDTDLAERHLANAWRTLSSAIRLNGLFVGVGIPYNGALICDEEIREMGAAISEIKKDVQVSLIDLRPAFRRKDIERPGVDDMLRAQRILLGTGLENVWALTPQGPVSPRMECC